METVNASRYRYRGLRQRSLLPYPLPAILIRYPNPVEPLPHANNPQRRSGPDVKYVSGSLANLDQKLKRNLTEKVGKREKETQCEIMAVIPGLIRRKKASR